MTFQTTSKTYKLVAQNTALTPYINPENLMKAQFLIYHESGNQLIAKIYKTIL